MLRAKPETPGCRCVVQGEHAGMKVRRAVVDALTCDYCRIVSDSPITPMTDTMFPPYGCEYMELVPEARG